MFKNEIMVSIICNVYNHEKYIREALDSFLMQKTNFAYEVLVHDDASTDHSADIIREYEKKYPNIIKPIYQTINQHTKCRITLTYQIPRVRGKYIAFCEGDDYWLKPYKLQKQFDEMESHPEIDMCAHAANVIKGNRIVDKIAAADKKMVFDSRHVILGDGRFFATNSLFWRTEMYRNMPSFYKFLGLDYMLQIWGSLRGGVLFLPDYMSTYRSFVENSWSDKTRKDKNFNIQQNQKIIEALQLVDLNTAGRYHDEVTKMVCHYNINNLLIQHRYHDIRHGKYAAFYKDFPLKRKMKILARQILHTVGLI